MRKIIKFALPAILVLALVLRLVSLNQSLWLDEATTALVAKMNVNDIFTKFLPGDFHPPFYYLLMKFWVDIFGSGEISLRIPSVIFGVGTVYFIYLIAKKLFNIKTGLVAALLSATSGLMIYYSQEARMYALAAFLVTLLFYLLLERKWIIFSITLAILGMTDYVALLAVPVFLVFAGKDFKKILLCLIPSALLYNFWIPSFLKQISGGVQAAGSNWWNILGTLSWKNLGLIPIKFILGRVGFDNKIIYGIIALVVCVVFGFLLIKARKASKLIWAWMIAPIVLGIIVSIKIPVLYYFRFLFCLPAFYILVGRGISMLSRKTFTLFLLITLLINIVFCGLYLFVSRYQRENWRAVAETVGEDVVVFPSNSQKEALVYYGKGDQITYFNDFNGRISDVWLSRYVWNIFDPKDLARIKIENLGYNKVQELNLNGVIFWKYHANRN